MEDQVQGRRSVMSIRWLRVFKVHFLKSQIEYHFKGFPASNQTVAWQLYLKVKCPSADNILKLAFKIWIQGVFAIFGGSDPNKLEKWKANMDCVPAKSASTICQFFVWKFMKYYQIRSNICDISWEGAKWKNQSHGTLGN